MTFELKNTRFTQAYRFCKQRSDIHRALLLSLLVSLPILWHARVWAQVDHRTVEEVRTIYPSEWGVAHPAGLSYSVSRDHLALIAKIESDQPIANNSNVVVITPYEDLIGSAVLSFVVDDAINIAYDDATNHLLLLNSAQAELAQVIVDDNGFPDPAALARFDIVQLGLGYADGMGVDRTNRRLFILDSETSEIVSADIDNDFALHSKIELSHLGAIKLHGIAVHPASLNLFVMSPSQEILYELTQSGQIVDTYDLAGLNLVDAGGLAFGPSIDLTDAPGTQHMFIADSNLRDGYSEQMFGRILEIALNPEQTAVRRTVSIQTVSDNDDVSVPRHRAQCDWQ